MTIYQIMPTAGKIPVRVSTFKSRKKGRYDNDNQVKRCRYDTRTQNLLNNRLINVTNNIPTESHPVSKKAINGRQTTHTTTSVYNKARRTSPPLAVIRFAPSDNTSVNNGLVITIQLQGEDSAEIREIILKSLTSLLHATTRYLSVIKNIVSKDGKSSTVACGAITKTFFFHQATQPSGSI